MLADASRCEPMLAMLTMLADRIADATDASRCQPMGVRGACTIALLAPPWYEDASLLQTKLAGEPQGELQPSPSA